MAGEEPRVEGHLQPAAVLDRSHHPPKAEVYTIAEHYTDSLQRGRIP